MEKKERKRDPRQLTPPPPLPAVALPGQKKSVFLLHPSSPSKTLFFPSSWEKKRSPLFLPSLLPVSQEERRGGGRRGERERERERAETLPPPSTVVKSQPCTLLAFFFPFSSPLAECSPPPWLTREGCRDRDERDAKGRRQQHPLSPSPLPPSGGNGGGGGGGGLPFLLCTHSRRFMAKDNGGGGGRMREWLMDTKAFIYLRVGGGGGWG